MTVLEITAGADIGFANPIDDPRIVDKTSTRIAPWHESELTNFFLSSWLQTGPELLDGAGFCGVKLYQPPSF